MRVSVSVRLLASPQGKQRQRPRSPLRYQTYPRFTLKKLSHFCQTDWETHEEETLGEQTDDDQVFMSRAIWCPVWVEAFTAGQTVTCWTWTVPSNTNTGWESLILLHVWSVGLTETKIWWSWLKFNANFLPVFDIQCLSLISVIPAVDHCQLCPCVDM